MGSFSSPVVIPRLNNESQVNVGAQANSTFGAEVKNRLNDLLAGSLNNVRSHSATSSDADYAADVEASVLSSPSSSPASSAPGRTGPTIVPDFSMEAAKKSSKGKRRERRISLSDDAPQPRPTSDSFKAKRQQHYNEIAALKAFETKRNSVSDDTGTESERPSSTSDGSDGNKQTTTNTNTNINQSSSKAVIKRWCKVKKRGPNSEELMSDEAPRQERSVSFSGESGGESSEEFRNLRRQRFFDVWKQDASVPITVCSVETNTNTNLNAKSSSSVFCARYKDAKNPMEAGRPPVKFGEQGEAEISSSSEAFREQRRRHYDEVRALEAHKKEGNITPDMDESSSNEMIQGEIDEDGVGTAINMGTVDSPNPMEPRLSGVTFDPEVIVDTGGLDLVGSTAGSSAQDHSENHQETAQAAWRAKRNAHYNDMAAVLRGAAPPSSDDEEYEDKDAAESEGMRSSGA